MIQDADLAMRIRQAFRLERKVVRALVCPEEHCRLVAEVHRTEVLDRDAERKLQERLPDLSRSQSQSHLEG